MLDPGLDRNAPLLDSFKKARQNSSWLILQFTQLCQINSGHRKKGTSMHEELIYVVIAFGFLGMLLVIFSFFTVDQQSAAIMNALDAS
jgi:hypothetical protein